MEQQEGEGGDGLVLVVRKPAYGLPTACPVCLPAYIYLRLANISFSTHYNLLNPDSDVLPSIEFGDVAGFHNETGGIFGFLSKEDIVDLDSGIPSHSLSDWLALKALICSYLNDAALFELWVNHNHKVANEIYFSDLPWPIGKILYWKQRRTVMQRLGVYPSNGQEREAELYRNAAGAYEALSTKLGDQTFLFENKPTSLDAIFLGHILFVLHTFNDSSILRQELKKHDNLVKYAENLKSKFLEASSSSPLLRSVPGFASSSRTGAKYRGPKEKNTKPKTEEEKTFRKRAKYFLITQFIAVLVFLTLMGSMNEGEVEMEDEDGMIVED